MMWACADIYVYVWYLSKEATWNSEDADEFPPWPFRWRENIEKAADSPGEASISFE